MGTKIQVRNTHKKIGCALSDQTFQMMQVAIVSLTIMQPIKSSQFNIIHVDWLHFGLSDQNFGQLKHTQKNHVF
jgi:hypothetical protein